LSTNRYDLLKPEQFADAENQQMTSIRYVDGRFVSTQPAMQDRWFATTTSPHISTKSVDNYAELPRCHPPEMLGVVTPPHEEYVIAPKTRTMKKWSAHEECINAEYEQYPSNTEYQATQTYGGSYAQNNFCYVSELLSVNEMDGGGGEHYVTLLQ